MCVCECVIVCVCVCVCVCVYGRVLNTAGVTHNMQSSVNCAFLYFAVHVAMFVDYSCCVQV